MSSTGPIAVRILGASDLAVLEHVDADVFDNPVRPELAAQFLANPGNVLAVAIESGVVVGMGSAIAYVHPDKPLALFINEVGVSRRCQGLGVGKRLMSALLDRGRLMGCTEAWVATEDDNTAARALYRSAGGREDSAHAVVFTWPLLDALDGYLAGQQRLNTTGAGEE